MTSTAKNSEAVMNIYCQQRGALAAVKRSMQAQSRVIGMYQLKCSKSRQRKNENTSAQCKPSVSSNPGQECNAGKATRAAAERRKYGTRMTEKRKRNQNLTRQKRLAEINERTECHANLKCSKSRQRKTRTQARSANKA